MGFQFKSSPRILIRGILQEVGEIVGKSDCDDGGHPLSLKVGPKKP